MHIGLLLCDMHYPSFPVPQRFKTLFRDHPHMDWTIYSLPDGVFPQSIDECDAYLISGSSHNPLEPLHWITQLTEFIHSLHIAQKKLIGICFGHQIIARTLGGTIQKMSHQAAFVAKTQMLQQYNWMQPALQTCNLVVMHSYEVTDLPHIAQHVAMSDYCKHAMYTVGNHIFCMQAHPEISRDFGLDIITHNRDAINTKNHEQDVKSFDLPVHQTEIAHWFVNFLKS